MSDQEPNTVTVTLTLPEVHALIAAVGMADYYHADEDDAAQSAAEKLWRAVK